MAPHFEPRFADSGKYFVRLQLERDEPFAVGAPLRGAQTAAAEHAEHRFIPGQHMGLEARDAIGAPDVREMAQQPAGDALPLAILSHGKGELGARTARHVAAAADQYFLGADSRDEGDVAR